MKKVEKVAKRCTNCDSEFFVCPSGAYRKCCSKKCQHEQRSKQMKTRGLMKCEGCGNDTLQTCAVRRFCSKQCELTRGWIRDERCKTPKKCVLCDVEFLAKDKRCRWCPKCDNPARRYGITNERYESLLKEHDGKCWVCGALPTGSRNFKRLHVDHDHVTGNVRGLLCPKCNSTVGFVETHSCVDAVLDYLRMFSITSVGT